jgi:CHAT domain-containing protein
VVLSACETALGLSPETVERGTADGREVSSVAQAFISAGANNVVASLWQVNDRATSVLMQQLYSNLAASNSPNVAQALQAAQLNLLGSQFANGEPTTRSGVNPTPNGNVVSVSGSGATTAEHAHPYYWASFILIGNGL